MKKTVKINLSGFVFTLDEDAYQELKNYLDAISSRFRDMEEGNEIISDIEARIAEIFQSKVNDKKQVITIQDVHNVIAILGKPEDFYDTETIGPGASSEKEVYTRKHYRKLYRDPENAIFGGVAAGLAAYFGIEAWIIRLLLIIFTFPIQVVPFIYIILWIVLPKAITAAQRLEMRGEKVTVSNIERTVKEEYESVKENVRRVGQSKEFQQTKNTIGEILHVFGQIILIIFKIILVFIGIGLIIAGITAIMGITSFIFFRRPLFPLNVWPLLHGYPLSELFHTLSDPGTFTLFSFAFLMVIAIPIIALIYSGIKLIFRFRANDKAIGLTGLVLWILSLICLAAIIVYNGRGGDTSGQIPDSGYYEPSLSDTSGVYTQKTPDVKNFRGDCDDDTDKGWQIISQRTSTGE